MICKCCKKEVRADCVYMDEVCVFCRHQTDTWEGNGQVILYKDVVK